MNTAEKQKLQALINLIIEEQVSLNTPTNLTRLDEGIVDSIKQFTTSAAGKVKVAWDSVKRNLDALASKMISTLTNGKNTATQIYNQSLETFKQTIEAFKLATTYAQQIGQPAPNLPQELNMIANIEQQAKAIGDEMIADASKAPALAKANKAQNESIYNINGYSLFLSEVTHKQQKILKEQKQLNEAGAVAGALGGFAILKLSCEGLYLLFKKINNPKAAQLAKFFHDRVYQLENIESFALKIIPDSWAFTFWLMTTNKGWKQIFQNAKAGNTQTLQQAWVEFQQNPEQISKIRKRMFIAIIGVLVGKGIVHLAHAGAQSITAVHAAIEGAHAAEVGLGMVEVIKDAALALGAVSLDSVADAASDAVNNSSSS
jgi:hypothetical protein